MKDPFPPDCASRYQVVRTLASGGFGTVYLAQQRALQRPVVVKLLQGDGPPDKEMGKEIGKQIGDVLVSLLLPAVRKVQSAADRAEQIQRNLHVESDPDLGRAALRVVENPIAFVHLDFTIVEGDRQRYDDLLFGLPEDFVEAGLQIQQLRGSVEARHHRFEWILLV